MDQEDADSDGIGDACDSDTITTTTTTTPTSSSTTTITQGGSCKGYCGLKSPDGCYCDSSCVMNGDCCPDYGQQCLALHPFKLLGNAQVKSTLIRDEYKFDIEGRASMYLEAYEADIKNGLVRVKGLNLVYFKVPQAPLTQGINPKQKEGTLGFAVDLSSKLQQYLQYNPKEASISGTVHGYVDADFMVEYADVNFDAKNDFIETPKQAADVHLNIKLSKPLSLDQTGDDIITDKAVLDLTLKANAANKLPFAAYEIVLPNFNFAVSYASPWLHIYRVLKSLRIQPVRIQDGEYSSGDGLSFGMPGLLMQWGKADVVFTINDWITLYDSDYWVLGDYEAYQLRAEVDVADAVEVFFVNDFVPQCLWGGGATWGRGTASTKIISSDGNARGGIDFTHLAHEIGHSIGLTHPGDAASPNGSTGTLMCPSGWMVDNPTINSKDNKDNISNPLFTWTFTKSARGWMPDCNATADCGACPGCCPDCDS